MLHTNAYYTGARVGVDCDSFSSRKVASNASSPLLVGVMSKVTVFENDSANEWDPANFDTIMHKYQTRIFRFIYLIVGETETANDLTQDTFFSAYRSLCRRFKASLENNEPSQRLSDNMSAWLYTIARNTAFSEMRRRKVVHFLSFWQRPSGSNHDDEFDAVHDFELNEPGGDVESRSVLNDELQRAIDQVGRKKLTALLLHIDGFSYKEICEITGDSLSSIKSQIFRAKENLRKALQSQKNIEIVGDGQGSQL